VGSTSTTGTTTPAPAAPASSTPGSDEVISSASGWRAHSDNNSSSNVSVGREQIDGREWDVLTISINLAGGNIKWAGATTTNMSVLQKFKNANGVRFKVLGDGKKWRVYFATSNVTDSAFHGTTITTQNGRVSTIAIPFSSLRQPDWKRTNIVFNKNNLTTFTLERTTEQGGTGASTIKVFDFEIY
jgi:hypothetical protein